MKILNNKEKWSEPLCSCNSIWPIYYEEMPGIKENGKHVYKIQTCGTPDNGKLFIMSGLDKPCPVCGMNKWRILE